VAAVKLFNSEEVVLNQEKGIPLSLRRAQFQPRKAPTAGLSLTLFGVCLLLLFYIGTWVQQRELISGIFISQWGLFLLPVVLVLLYVRVDLRSALSLRPFRWATLPAMSLIWIGMLVLVNLYAQWQQEYVPVPESYEGMMRDLFRTDGSVTRATVLLLAVALSPAICEEVLFRGAILSGLRTAFSPLIAVLITGVLFGLMHLSVSSILPTAMLGVAMGYIVVRSGSIYPAMLFHLLNNSAAVVLNDRNVKERFDGWMIERSIEAQTLVTWLIPAAIVALVAGVGVMELTSRKRADRTQ
jgi:sodium transport system permease protein